MHLSRQPEGESLQAHLLWYVKDDLLATYKSSTLFLVRLLTRDNAYSSHKCSQSTGTFAVSISLFIRGRPSSSTCLKQGKLLRLLFLRIGTSPNVRGISAQQGKCRTRGEYRRQPKAGRRRLPHMLHGIRPREGRNCLVPRPLRE